MFCPYCGSETAEGSAFCQSCGKSFATKADDRPGMPLKYKVVEQKQQSFLKGRMSAQDLEDLINTHATSGWTLDRIVAGETARFMGIGEKDVFLLIFRQEAGEQRKMGP